MVTNGARFQRYVLGAVTMWVVVAGGWGTKPEGGVGTRGEQGVSPSIYCIIGKQYCGQASESAKHTLLDIRRKRICEG